MFQPHKTSLLFTVILVLTALALPVHSEKVMPVTPPSEKALFAGGCFWCMEKPFETIPGVTSVISGYTTGHSKKPTYKNYIQGGHLEAIEVTFNPQQVSYKKLLAIFWHQINPTDAHGQFIDRGYAYSTGIFYFNEQQRKEAESSKTALAKSGRFNKTIVTVIKPAEPFYAAEEYHQNYYKKNPVRYWYYRNGSGRDPFLDKIWGKDRGNLSQKGTDNNFMTENLKSTLTPLQYKVTQKNGTEPPFKNAYWNNKKAGIYVDIISGEPLFSSLEKFKSGTGWPSFTRPLVTENIIEKEDRGFFTVRTEIRSKKGNSHLGHVFNDGPQPTGLRYCINSASLKFISVAELDKEGYIDFLPLFKK